MEFSSIDPIQHVYAWARFLSVCSSIYMNVYSFVPFLLNYFLLVFRLFHCFLRLVKESCEWNGVLSLFPCSCAVFMQLPESGTPQRLLLAVQQNREWGRGTRLASRLHGTACDLCYARTRLARRIRLAGNLNLLNA